LLAGVKENFLYRFASNEFRNDNARTDSNQGCNIRRYKRYAQEREKSDRS